MQWKHSGGQPSVGQGKTLDASPGLGWRGSKAVQAFCERKCFPASLSSLTPTLWVKLFLVLTCLLQKLHCGEHRLRLSPIENTVVLTKVQSRGNVD